MMAHSLAEHYRAHREAFLLAQEMGCTPKEAAAELKNRAARKEWLDGQVRLRAKLATDDRLSLSALRAGHTDEDAPRAPWWQD